MRSRSEALLSYYVLYVVMCILLRIHCGTVRADDTLVR